MEQIDNLLKPNPSHPVNIIEVAEHPETPAEPIASAMLQEIGEDQTEETDYEVERLEILLNEAKKKAATGKRQKFDGVVIPTKVGPPGRGASKAQQSPPPIPKSPAAKKKAATGKRQKFDGVVILTKVGLLGRGASKVQQLPPPIPKLLAVSRSSPQQDDIRKPLNPQPQYRYVVPIEDSNAVSNVLTWMLNMSITLSQRELLSIASELRNQLKELTTAKRYNAANVNLIESLSYAAQLCGTASQ
ncbi:hypothetical protein A7U60_g2329 [Sanghuangporus baumii]|uniref:DUF4100 domain-containing protein n=1 Tax=Sanghuangporus baumii TaxID=108892 RepID=A0A9Q5I2F1_SANBA|nr:hypothetical protein A7U60_g2329 [Sanghuangporus baumii]